MNYLIEVNNGDIIELKKSTKIKRIWTILDEEFTINDIPKHNINAFLEDKWHDWHVNDMKLHTHFHSSSLGEKHRLLIIEEL
ncbi:MAG: hypothetical protein PHC28_04935 [Flavobacterium sp.]|uniref:hypothetical protein n=1 Tax=Flavobacterium sp. TaxID=239 RepID=UPI002619E9AA|nr:hypothetical protein [Flavobacterium sp.]MDD5149811.1 hypothetical protein [Flavobacterium sp.]